MMSLPCPETGVDFRPDILFQGDGYKGIFLISEDDNR